MEINRNIRYKKDLLLDYFRSRSSEFLSEIRQRYGSTQYKLQASAINQNLIASKVALLENVIQKANKESWTNDEKLESVLMITYANYIIMLESRNDVWPYEYMTFSRRIGELWEPFCKLCFLHPINDIELFVPPTFLQVKETLTVEIESYIETLKITEEEKNQLVIYYNKVWGLVTSGEIKLELDLHFKFNGFKYNVDFKSGFGSNEKGNTNRLLLVASIYQNINEDYKCLLFVRSNENNHYFETLKNSGVWSAYSSDATYQQINYFTGFNLKEWIEKNVNWEFDFKNETYKFLLVNELTQYLIW
jgi:hypothetical protein